MLFFCVSGSRVVVLCVTSVVHRNNGSGARVESWLVGSLGPVSPCHTSSYLLIYIIKHLHFKVVLLSLGNDQIDYPSVFTRSSLFKCNTNLLYT
jgi:hypothetical protein